MKSETPDHHLLPMPFEVMPITLCHVFSSINLGHIFSPSYLPENKCVILSVWEY